LIKTIQSEPNTSLNFIGTENQNHKIALQKIIEEHQLENKVTFYGFQKTQNLISLLAQAEVVIFPSTGETFGLALCEAMALNKVVIASNIPSFNEIITSGENGYIVDTVEEYCNVILKTFSDSNEANRIKSNARKSIMERFSQEKMIEETINYYEKVITEFKN
jgi:glycosyltransferase involved in cell wall biosynthesis